MLEVIVRSVTAPAPAMIYAPTLLDYKYKSGKFVYGRSHVKLRNRCPSSAAHQLLQHSRRFITCFITNLIIYCTINISRRFGSLRFFFFFFARNYFCRLQWNFSDISGNYGVFVSSSFAGHKCLDGKSRAR